MIQYTVREYKFNLTGHRVYLYFLAGSLNTCTPRTSKNCILWLALDLIPELALWTLIQSLSGPFGTYSSIHVSPYWAFHNAPLPPHLRAIYILYRVNKNPALKPFRTWVDEKPLFPWGRAPVLMAVFVRGEASYTQAAHQTKATTTYIHLAIYIPHALCHHTYYIGSQYL